MQAKARRTAGAPWPALARALLCAALSGCGGASDAPPQLPAQRQESLSAAAALGEQMFDDRSLSASGAQACSTCHNPNNAHAQTNELSVQLGGVGLDQHGLRAAPSLRYLDLTPAFSIDANGLAKGGFDHDGRAPTLAAQARDPLLASFEMANASPAAVVRAVRAAPYADAFRLVFGANIFDDPDAAFERITFALQQYQLEERAFHGYDSKYDSYLEGRASLSEAELRGLALFNDSGKGNCAACHPSARGPSGAPPLFTDFAFRALGVPRNADIAANADANYFDMGLCGPNRSDWSAMLTVCGAFKTPTLRNVATRKVLFHNGSAHSLREALRFLVGRDTNPDLWYRPTADGQPQIFNDLPLALRANVDTFDAPFNRHRGDAPALSDAEIDDLLQFLGTLDDGYVE